jgi:hypothetical protein
MRRVPALVGVSLLLAAVSSSAQRADPTGATVALQGVVRSATGVALRSARIAVQLTNGAPRVRVAADESGRFSVKLPGSVPYRLTAAKPGYAPVTLANEAGIRADATTDIVLEKGAAISGSVVDRFGDPMVSLSVFVVPTDVGRSTEEHATLTDERGAFRVGSLADGEYQLQLSRAPAVFNSEQGGLTVPHIDNYQSTMSPRTVVVARHEDTQLNLVFDAGPNRVELGAVAVDSFMRDRERDGRAASRVDANATIIEGWVATATGRVARGAVVELEPVTPGPPRRTSADADGHYRFDDVNPGRYAIWARRDGFSPKQFDQSMRPTGQVIRVQPRVPATASLTMSSGSVVSGIVVDRFGDPIEGAAVELQTVSFASGRGILRGAGSPADVRTTDDLGRYSFPEVDTGTYYVAAR